MWISRVFRNIAAGIIGMLCVACAPALTRLPAGPGTPTEGDEAGVIYFDASRHPCSLEPLTAVASIRGTIGTQPINGQFSFAGSVMRLRLESIGGRPRDFVFTAEEGNETFVYRGAYRIVGKSADMIETILGLPLNAEDLRRVLTGCPRISGSLEGFRMKDRWFQVRLDGDGGYDVYTQRDSQASRWMIRAIDGAIQGTTNRWRAEFQRDSKGLPKSVRVVSTTWNGTFGEHFDVRLALRRVRVNPQLPPDTFRIELSSSVTTTDLDGFRRSRPRPAPFLVDSRVKPLSGTR
jgi:hypothetical protein